MSTSSDTKTASEQHPADIGTGAKHPADTSPDVEQHPAEKIADYLEEHGWIQGEFGDAGDARCISGAGAGIFGLGVWYDEVYPIVADRIGVREGKSWSISDWNDAEGRTYEEVIAALRGTSGSE